MSDTLNLDHHRDPATSDETSRRFVEAAKISVRHYRDTTLHVTHKELGDWIESLKLNPNASPPICHV